MGFPTQIYNFDITPLIDCILVEELPLAVANFHRISEQKSTHLFRAFEFHGFYCVGWIDCGAVPVIIYVFGPALEVRFGGFFRDWIVIPGVMALHRWDWSDII